MTQNCVSFYFLSFFHLSSLVEISFNTAGGHWDDSLNTPLHLLGDSHCKHLQQTQNGRLTRRLID